MLGLGGYFGMAKAWVWSWVIQCVSESPHKDRNTCVCCVGVVVVLRHKMRF